ncbi:MAG TPA: YggU family protein [Candidatus Atribacteria bacterium]|nr:YggU family protein [Candidatus Atribacteria bacterium]
MNDNTNDFFKIVGNNIIIKLKIIPNSSKDKIIGIHNSALKIAIAAPPVEGKANKKCISFLAKYFDIAKSKIEIISGINSKNKLIRINNINPKEFLDKIEKIV